RIRVPRRAQERAVSTQDDEEVASRELAMVVFVVLSPRGAAHFHSARFQPRDELCQRRAGVLLLQVRVDADAFHRALPARLRAVLARARGALAPLPLTQRGSLQLSGSRTTTASIKEPKSRALRPEGIASRHAVTLSRRAFRERGKPRIEG